MGLVDNLCMEKELKVRISELQKKRRVVKGKTYGRLLPRVGDYSTRALLQPDCDMNPKTTATCAANRTKRKGKKSWARKKIKTGRRLLLSLGVTLTAPTPD